jgi:H+-transporting ATPase
VLRFDTPHLQSLTFAAIIFGSEAGVYLLRERGHCWASVPSRAMVLSMLMALSVTAFITLVGFHVPAISPQLFGAVGGIAVIYFFALDWLKVWLFARLQVR